VLAMAMALGVTTSAYAANPFSDVPAGHWAYDSVAKLAAAGVVDGYADGAFDGDKLMTRYEMAQIVAKAMAKGADCDKLAAEFADELDTLGVRVAKLEKGADAVKITGQVRFRYQDHDKGSERGKDKSDIRTRLWVTGQVNDDWTYTAMLQSQQDVHDSDAEDGIDLNRAYLNGKLGGMDVQAGRWDEVTSSGAVLDTYLDGVKVAYGNDVKVWALAGKAADADHTNTGAALTLESDDRVYAAGVETKFGPVNAYANWFKVHADAIEGDKEIYNVAANMEVAKELTLSYEYMWGDHKYDEKVSKDGYIVGLNYKGADASAAGTYGVHAFYYDQPSNAWLSPTFDCSNFIEYGGYEGWSFGVDYTVAKNVQLCVNYYDTESKYDNKEDKSIFTELYFFF
ncbi:MAG: S-layer homology domain-containing protein, partial [Phascolarctobacterium sp.]|nr:S-layer homology domain-containing protein [Phascolarctobacterium sp.]